MTWEMVSLVANNDSDNQGITFGVSMDPPLMTAFLNEPFILRWFSLFFHSKSACPTKKAYEMCVVYSKKYVNDIWNCAFFSSDNVKTLSRVFHTLEKLNVHPQNITLHFVLPTSALTVWEVLIKPVTPCLVELQTPAFIRMAFTAMMKYPLIDQKLLCRAFFPHPDQPCLHFGKAFRI